METMLRLATRMLVVVNRVEVAVDLVASMAIIVLVVGEEVVSVVAAGDVVAASTKEAKVGVKMATTDNRVKKTVPRPPTLPLLVLSKTPPTTIYNNNMVWLCF